LDAREGSARSQPVITRGKSVQFTTIGEDIADDRRIVLLFDIHCNGKSAWNAVLPLNESSVGGMDATDENGEDVDVSIVHPLSSRTLGDATDAATIHPFQHAFESTRYLLSTDIGDTRTWIFNVSMVSRNCLETLIHSCCIVPAMQKKCIDEYDAWEPNSGYHQVDKIMNQAGEFKEFYENMYSLTSPDPNLFRCSDLENVTQIPTSTLKGIGMKGDVCELCYFSYFEFCYWLDERNPTEKRLHLTLDFNCPSSLFSDMIMHDRTKSTTSPDSSEENAAKRHCSV